MKMISENLREARKYEEAFGKRLPSSSGLPFISRHGSDG